MKLGLVLEGGGMRGIYSAGVLDVFLEHELFFDGVIGVSAGAIHGCSFVSKQTGRNIRYYQKYCQKKEFMSIRNWIKTGDIVGNEFCYHEIPDKLDPFDHETFNQSKTDFYVTCTNLETGKPNYFLLQDMRKQVDLLRASASLPFFSHIVEYKERKLLDGGVSDSIPVIASQKMGYLKNVVVLTRHKGYQKKEKSMCYAKLFYSKYPKFVKTMQNRSRVYNRTLQKIQQLEEDGSVFVIQPSEELHIGRLENDPKKILEVYHIGRKDAMQSIERLLQWMEEARNENPSA